MAVPDSLLVAGKIPEHTMVRVENIGTQPHTFKWAKASYHLEPGQKSFVPYYAMVLSCGDPRTFDVPGDPRRTHRTDEYKRLCVKYGVYQNHHLFDERVPKLRVTTIEDEEIVTVLQDPFGEQDGPEAERIATDQQLAASQDAMKQQIQQLQAQLALLQSGDESETTPATEGDVGDVDDVDGNVDVEDAASAKPVAAKKRGPGRPPKTRSADLPVDSPRK